MTPLPAARPPRPALDPGLEAALVASGGLKSASLTPERIAAERTLESVDRPTLTSLGAVEGVGADEVSVAGSGGNVMLVVLGPPHHRSGTATRHRWRTAGLR